MAHILEAIRRIEENTAAGRDTSMRSHTLQDAVLRNLQTMSEATQRLSPDLKARYPEIPWTQVASFRDVIVHNYLGIDLENISRVIQRAVPPRKHVVVTMRDEVT